MKYKYMSSINPLDGRYSNKIKELSCVMDEASLSTNRMLVEIKYLQALSNLKIKDFKLNLKEKKILENILPLSKKDLQDILDIEKTTNHDVKAIEYFIAKKLKNTSLKNRLNFIHFALTSEDINSVSYALMLRDGLEKAILPSLKNILKTLDAMAKKYANITMLARTHGQPAVPTTFGKEIRVFHYRLKKQIAQLEAQKISAKFSGAVGSFNAHCFAYPEINWQNFSKKFIAEFNKQRKIKIYLNEISTQIDPHDSFAETFHTINRVNNILIDFSQDMWRYISDDWLSQKTVKGEIGSSTMPQKINPIDFENAEGNLGLANAMFGFFANKLMVSRLQRDLSDSTVQRNIASSLGYSLVAYKALLKGLNKIEINKKKINEYLNSHPEVLAEGIQTILRQAGVKNPYELLKGLTRGKTLTYADLDNFIEKLDVSASIKTKLRNISFKNYSGISEQLARKK
ncbi:MAG: adenylosuccinate lyase [Elusimicrobiaceae bacterium]|nr:adenylosuccinate lyase [Elusimicrobiaceae bacterium]MBT3954693.1 adenylosuccinate lyase [Elusimicrobiaceae bacterium]MBT4008045.1 adenylosuccinate lyase [Elusimicrobiaceae bacterium]MBT4402604.1 adenylosuccinate lyase [Elusimicrobiaceae bacterium]MBT4439359.1 adenylosuccinate lyase [Elusimicrobiaceae bacterium]